MSTHDQPHPNTAPPIPLAEILPEARYHAEQLEVLGDKLTSAAEEAGRALHDIGEADAQGSPWARYLSALHVAAGRTAALGDMAQHNADALVSLSERLSGGYLRPDGAGPWTPPSDPSDAASGC